MDRAYSIPGRVIPTDLKCTNDFHPRRPDVADIVLRFIHRCKTTTCIIGEVYRKQHARGLSELLLNMVITQFN